MTVCDLVLAGLAGLLRRLVLELAVVHELADRRAGHRGDLDEVEVCLLRQPQRVADGDDADLLTVRTDQAHLVDADPVVDPGLSADGASRVSSRDLLRAPDTRKAPVAGAHGSLNTQPAPGHPLHPAGDGDRRVGRRGRLT